MKQSGLECANCGKVAKETKLRFQGFKIDGWHCSSCGEDYFNPEQAQRILLLNKIMKKKYEVTVGQMRSNLIIRIPIELAKAIGLQKGEKVKIKAEGMHTLHVET
jgi:hypothetical protein